MEKEQRSSSPFGNQFLLMSTDKTLAHVLCRHIDDWRVLHIIVCSLGYGNHVVVNQVEIAKYLDIQRSRVTRAVKRLVEAGILAEKGTTTEKGCKIYTLTPEYFWRGSPEQHRAALRKQTQAATGLSVIDGGRS